MAIALHEQIATTLRQQIATGSYRVGDALPSEAALREVFGVSRGPVRQALAALQSEGLIALSQGKPATVRRLEQFQTLRTFTPFSRWARSGGRVPSSKTLELSRRRPARAVAESLGVGADDFVVELVRVRFLDGEPAMVERSSFVEPVGSLLFEFDTDSGSITDFLAAKGVRFETMEHVFDAVAAEGLDADELGVPTGAPLLRERRSTWDQSGSLFEIADDRYRPDLVTFKITNAQGL
ncbi:GntR family transcriptional regulator [Segniliparus rugosus]|uniref:HTH gntR-type domain-containing protein n=1 Tax=Segniliparus rugosus (strain ATCC BAA-974 / DSM 45345 / CCUG 50838 / CIP 108380 / JCM 13579 / CDC 945) TaxID=679197 RepID=E5XMX6_SEGRC|nr:GntR family transcriptional regulator [Segniliparus rugosus]EFV14302.1 hypothetical protein HMPREF9336_00846 [Segniliparus rugosus ATCC BAA-974]